MGQRISIQYTIDVDDLPEYVVRLLTNATTEINSLPSVEELSLKTVDDIMTLQTVNDIDELRASLGRIDFMLADVNNLITSFISYQTRPATEEVQAPPPHQELPPQSFEDLQDKINLFKEKLATESQAENEVAS